MHAQDPHSLQNPTLFPPLVGNSWKIKMVRLARRKNTTLRSALMQSVHLFRCKFNPIWILQKTLSSFWDPLLLLQQALSGFSVFLQYSYCYQKHPIPMPTELSFISLGKIYRLETAKQGHHLSYFRKVLFACKGFISCICSCIYNVSFSCHRLCLHAQKICLVKEAEKQLLTWQFIPPLSSK